MITKEVTDLADRDFQNGESLLIDKPKYWSSFKVVHVVRKAVGVKKVGHAGTLDPMATGLLILCTGKMTKEITSFQDQEKTYTGTILLGKTSPSMDLETEVSKAIPVDVTEDEVMELRNEFLGKTLQVPPMYSAVKINGKNLYHLARKGKTVERKPREICITGFEITGINLPEVYFEITCSKGTYIRVIAHDFGERLGCGALLSSLRRTRIGSYSVDDAFHVQDFMDLISKGRIKPEKAEAV